MVEIFEASPALAKPLLFALRGEQGSPASGEAWSTAGLAPKLGCRIGAVRAFLLVKISAVLVEDSFPADWSLQEHAGSVQMPGNGRTAPEDGPWDGYLLFAVVIIVNWLLMSVQFCPGNKTALGSAGPWHWDSQPEVPVPFPAVLSAKGLIADVYSWLFL